MTHDSQEYRLTFVPRGKSGKVSVTVTQGKKPLFTDTLCVENAKDRAEFLNQLMEKFPGLDSDELEDRLEEIASPVQDSHGDDSGRESQADKLIACVEIQEGVELFHTPGGDDARAMVSVTEDDLRKTWPLDSKPFRGWLLEKFYKLHGKAPSTQPMTDAISTLEARAVFDGPEIEVHTHSAFHEGRIYIDKRSDDWSAFELTGDGWQVASDEDLPIRFVRARGMKPLGTPTRGGSINRIKDFVNLESVASFILFVATLVSYFWPIGPYVILLVTGEKGSAKSTLCRIVRLLIDPSRVPLRRPPKTELDLMIAAENTWIVCLDNVSKLSDDISDALCTLATGGGFGTRELYTTAEERLFDLMRPVVLNCIANVATRSDLLDRSILLQLPAISDSDRSDENSFWAEFEDAKGEILGALFDIACGVLHELPSVSLPSMFRMADFSRLAVAVGKVVGWSQDDVLSALNANRVELLDFAVEAEPVAPALLEFATAKGAWEGTATELLDALTSIAMGSTKRLPEGFPKAANSLTAVLRRLRGDFRAKGIEIEFNRDSASYRTRLISIEVVPDDSPNLGSDGPDDPDDHSPTFLSQGGSGNERSDGPDGPDDDSPSLYSLENKVEEKAALDPQEQPSPKHPSPSSSPLPNSKACKSSSGSSGPSEIDQRPERQASLFDLEGDA